MTKYYTDEEKQFELDGTFLSYYCAMVKESGLIWGFKTDGDYNYVAVESAEDAAVTIHQFDLDGQLVNVFPACEEFNSVDEFLNFMG